MHKKNVYFKNLKTNIPILVRQKYFTVCWHNVFPSISVNVIKKIILRHFKKSKPDFLKYYFDIGNDTLLLYICCIFDIYVLPFLDVFTIIYNNILNVFLLLRIWCMRSTTTRSLGKLKCVNRCILGRVNFTCCGQGPAMKSRV